MATIENDKATISESAHQIRSLSLTPLFRMLSSYPQNPSTGQLKRETRVKGGVERHLIVRRFFIFTQVFHLLPLQEVEKGSHTSGSVQHLKTDSKMQCLPAVRPVP